MQTMNLQQKMNKTSILPLIILVTAALPLAAQTPVFDTSGNGRLNGAYYFRQVLYGVSDTADEYGITGDISDAISLYGNITFDGNGNYSITNGFVADAANSVANDPLSCYLAESLCPATQSQPVAGTYSISASGYGFLLNQITGDSIYGTVAANGVFSGSSTETTSAYSDLFIASPVPSPALTNFSGTYNAVGFTSGGDFAFQMSPNGSGNIGTVNISGYLETAGAQDQSSNVTYRFSNSAGVLVFPTNNNAPFISGQEFIYFSPDGQFFFGGSDSGFDMIMGVTNATSDASFGACNNGGGTSCLFDVAGIDQNLSDVSSGYADLDSYYGSINTTNSGAIIGHERLSDLVFEESTYGFVFSDTFPYPATGAYTDTTQGFSYWVGDGGTVRIGEGTAPFLGITLAVQAPAFNPTTPVYINPTGIVNAASFAPFTAGVANGEFISIFGTNLAPSTVVASTVPYPTQLNNVQVMINNVPAPLYYVSSGQISAIVPSGDPYSLAQIQVINNGTASNIVTTAFGAPGSTPTTVATPGVYNYPPASGFAAAVNTNTGTIVTQSNPANPGDTIEVFLSGLGTVYPTVPDGAAPPVSPLSYTVNTVMADVDGTTATVVFAGLAPTLAGLYQVNVTIPTSTTAGLHFLDFGVSNPSDTSNPFNLEAYTQQVLIPVGGGAAARPAEVAPHRQAKPHGHAGATRKPLCVWTCRAGKS